MSQVLEMKFDTANGKVFTISVNNPKANLTSTDVTNAMETIINQDIFHHDGTALVAIKQARIIDKTITDII